MHRRLGHRAVFLSSRRAQQIVFAIGQHETGWRHDAHGKSGEQGALQFLASTWATWSTQILGYVAPRTLINERYVAVRMVDSWLNQGLSERQIALMWNQGTPGPCRAGVNKYGVPYDSCQYAAKVLAFIDL